MSTKRKEAIEKKLAVLEIIRDKKAILFGNFKANNITAEEKAAAWRVVLDKAQSLGLAGTEKPWTYARDTLFGVWKSRAMAKRDNARKTGTGGGENKKFDEIDKAIFNIIDKDSPVLDGLGLPETDGQQPRHEENCITENKISEESLAGTSRISSQILEKKTAKKRKHCNTINKEECNSKDWQEKLKEENKN